MFIGPYDLSLAHGFPPPSPDPHPEVEKLIQQILAMSHAKNKKWCAPLRPSPSSPRSCVELTLSSYTFLLVHGADGRLNTMTATMCTGSAIYCISGKQAAKRAKEGFDMVRPPFLPFRPRRTRLNALVLYVDQRDIGQRCHGRRNRETPCRRSWG